MPFDFDPFLRINTARLQSDLERAELMDKTLRTMNRDNLRALAQAFGTSVHDTEPPWWETGRDGKRTLHIPFNAPHSCKWWLHDDTGKAMRVLLHNMNATTEELTRYVGAS